MLRKEKTKAQQLLEIEFERALKALKNHPVSSKEYTETLSYAKRLHEMMDSKSSPVSKDAMLTVGGNLLGILMILKHESINVITSKALSFVIRP